MITFANNSHYETIAILDGHMQYQNAYRETLEIIFSADNITFEDAKNIYMNAAALSEILVETPNMVTKTLDDNSVVTEEVIEKTMVLNFTIPIELKFTRRNGEDVLIMKVAQKSDLEVAQECQAEKIQTLTEAAIELASIVGGDSNG